MRHCLLYCLNTKDPYIINMYLGDMENCLPADLFCKVHRSFIAGIYHRRRMNKTMTRIYYQFDITVHVSETYLGNYLQKSGVPENPFMTKNRELMTGNEDSMTK